MKPHIEYRVSLDMIPKQIRTRGKFLLKLDNAGPCQPQPQRKAVQGRCYLCGRGRNKNSRKSCFKCNKWNHPERGGDPGYVTSLNFPVSKKYFLAFKGKRYVHGIGSETRNSLYHLHNEKDVVLVTTCRHGKSWKELKDERCDEDNLEYDR
ncbi:hypothetical protein J6590_075624 [Homalodisca vitripennis]|nr:hypothetical protein J6590_075624 [Homalodisca vitripennis]